jgi:chromosome segregation ATPase
VLVVVLVLVSIALCVTLGMLLFGPGRGSSPAKTVAQGIESESKARSVLENELEKRRRELEEHRVQVNELKDQLKQAKRKLFEQKEQEKDGRGIAKAREEVERNASLQLEVVRSELSAALAELEKLRSEANPDKPKRHAPPPPVVVESPPQPAVVAPSPTRRFRELSDADRERIQRLEQQAAKDRGRALELERETKRLRGRMETQHRIYVVTKGELDLVKDKFKALEKRLNRTLLERDLLRRAIQDVERKSGILAERTELTPEEIADSDRKVEEKSLPSQPGTEERAADDVEENHPEAAGGGTA